MKKIILLILFSIFIFTSCSAEDKNCNNKDVILRGECVKCRAQYGMNKTQTISFTDGHGSLQGNLYRVLNDLQDANERLRLKSEHNCCKISFSQYHYKRNQLIGMLESALSLAKQLPDHNRHLAATSEERTPKNNKEKEEGNNE